MKIIQHKIVNWMLFPGYKAINLFGVMFIRPNARITKRTINHESIHSAQIKEVMGVCTVLLLLLFGFSWFTLITSIFSFYIWYVLEWFIKLFFYNSGDEAYQNISFEKEAYKYDKDYEYLDKRKIFSFIKFI